MVNKLIKDVNQQTWQLFTGYCKMNDVKVGKKLTKILNNYLIDKKIINEGIET